MLGPWRCGQHAAHISTGTTMTTGRTHSYTLDGTYTRRDDEHPMCNTASHQFGYDQTRFNCLAETDAICQQEPYTTHPDRTQHWNELIRLYPQASGLHRQQGVRSEGLLQQERLMVDQRIVGGYALKSLENLSSFMDPLHTCPSGCDNTIAVELVQLLCAACPHKAGECSSFSWFLYQVTDIMIGAVVP